MRNLLKLVILVMCACLTGLAQVPPYQRTPWTTNIPGSINAFATNTTIRTNLHVSGPTDSVLFRINTNEFIFSNLNANLGPLGRLGQGKEYGSPANTASGYVQPYSSADGHTRIWNTGPFNIFFATDDQLRMRLDSPGNLGIGGVPSEKLHVISGNGRIDGNFFVQAPTNGIAPPPFVIQPIGMHGCLLANTTNTITVVSANTYYVVTGYGHVHTNGFTANAASGFLTNMFSGFYRVTINLSFKSSTSDADTIAVSLFVNETVHSEIGLIVEFSSPAKVRTASCTGVVYLPAGSWSSVRVSNDTDTDDIEVWKSGFTIGTP